jgi:uncharacterized protein involved in exopolysaccharide biosynthesis
MVDGWEYNGDQPYADDTHEALRPLREHVAFIVVFIVSAMLSALTITYVYAERYLGETTVFFKPADVTLINEHSTQAFGSPFPTTPFKVISQTITGLVDSDAVLRQVVRQLHLDVPEPKNYTGSWFVRTYKEWKDTLSDYASDAWKVMKWGRVIPDDPENKAVGELRRHVKVRNDDSYVFTLRVTDKTPERATAEADALADSLVQALHRDVDKYASRRAADLAALQAQVAARMDDVEANIRDLLASNDIASIQQEVEKDTSRIAKLQQAQADSQASLREAEQQVAAITDKLRQYAPAIAARDPDGPPVRRQAGLTADDYAKLTYDRLTTDITASGLRARLDSIHDSLAALIPRLRMLNQIEASYDLLSAKLQAAKRDYVAVTDAAHELAIKGTSDATELRIQNKAELPEAPVSPIKFYHVGFAGLLAALIAVGLAYVLDFFRVRLFLPEPRRERQRVGGAHAVVTQAPISLDAD